MTLTIKSVLLLIAIVLMILSAIGIGSRVDLFKLAWAFVVASLVLG